MVGSAGGGKRWVGTELQVDDGGSLGTVVWRRGILDFIGAWQAVGPDLDPFCPATMSGQRTP
jgi:hypothetical protein